MLCGLAHLHVGGAILPEIRVFLGSQRVIQRCVITQNEIYLRAAGDDILPIYAEQHLAPAPYIQITGLPYAACTTTNTTDDLFTDLNRST